MQDKTWDVCLLAVWCTTQMPLVTPARKSNILQANRQMWTEHLGGQKAAAGQWPLQPPAHARKAALPAGRRGVLCMYAGNCLARQPCLMPIMSWPNTLYRCVMPHGMITF